MCMRDTVYFRPVLCRMPEDTPRVSHCCLEWRAQNSRHTIKGVHFQRFLWPPPPSQVQRRISSDSKHLTPNPLPSQRAGHFSRVPLVSKLCFTKPGCYSGSIAGGDRYKSLLAYLKIMAMLFLIIVEKLESRLCRNIRPRRLT